MDGFQDLRGVDPKVPKRKFMMLKDPFWEGEEVVLIPSIRPDVCLIHAQEAGEDGTVRIAGGVPGLLRRRRRQGSHCVSPRKSCRRSLRPRAKKCHSGEAVECRGGGTVRAHPHGRPWILRQRPSGIILRPPKARRPCRSGRRSGFSSRARSKAIFENQFAGGWQHNGGPRS